MEQIAEDHVGRHWTGPAPMQAADDRAGAGPLGAGDVRVAEPAGPGPAPGQPHRPGDAMVRLVVVHRPHQRELVGATGQVREQLADLQAGDPGRDRRERTPILDRGIRLHVERVELARRPPEPEQDDRSGFAIGHLSRGAHGQVIGERQPQRAEGPDAQEGPPRQGTASSTGTPSDPQHGSDPPGRLRWAPMTSGHYRRNPPGGHRIRRDGGHQARSSPSQRASVSDALNRQDAEDAKNFVSRPYTPDLTPAAGSPFIDGRKLIRRSSSRCRPPAPRKPRNPRIRPSAAWRTS